MDGQTLAYFGRNDGLAADGPYVIEHSTATVPLRDIDFNGDLKGASSTIRGVELSYSSSSRAIAILGSDAWQARDRRVETVAEMTGPMSDAPPGSTHRQHRGGIAGVITTVIERARARTAAHAPSEPPSPAGHITAHELVQGRSSDRTRKNWLRPCSRG